MNQKRILSTIIAIAAISSIVLVGLDSATANENNIRQSMMEYGYNLPEKEFTVNKGETLTFPLEIVAVNEKALDLKVYVTEAFDYPNERAPFGESVFSDGLTASLSVDEIKQNAKVGKDFVVRDTVNVTVNVSEDTTSEKRVLAITLLEGTYPNQSFRQTFVPITIAE